jgi:transketolase
MISFDPNKLIRETSVGILNEKNLSIKAEKIQCFAQQCRLDTFDMIHLRGNGHWGGSASVADILATFYFHVMNIDPANPKWDDRDKLILSKGHGAPMLYQIWRIAAISM